MKLQNYIISEDTKVIEAMDIINKNSSGIAFICDGFVLKGVVTDGNIRRYILENGDLNFLVNKVANYSPKYIMKNDSNNSKAYMKKNHIAAVPILNEDCEIVSIDFLNFNKVYRHTSLDIPVIIMAGGKGTRLDPFTRVLPKPLIPIGEKTITEHIIEKFKLFGCKKFDLIVNYKKNLIKTYFQDLNKDYDVVFTEENNYLGTGGGLKLVKYKYNSTMFISNCDILIEDDYGEMINYHKNNHNIITMICSMQKFEIPYGIVEPLKEENSVIIKEKPSLSFMINTGMYIIEPQFLEYIPDDTFMHITEIIERCIQAKERIGTYVINSEAWMDMGNLGDLEKMRDKVLDEME